MSKRALVRTLVDAPAFDPECIEVRFNNKRDELQSEPRPNINKVM